MSKALKKSGEKFWLKGVCYPSELEAFIYKGEQGYPQKITKSSELYEVLKKIADKSLELIKDKDALNCIQEIKETEYTLFLIENNHPSISHAQKKLKKETKKLLNTSLRKINKIIKAA